MRVEFWGDTVEEIRWFTVADQRSLQIAEHGLWAPPCRELLLTEAVRQRAAALADAPARRGRPPREAVAGHRRRRHGVPRPGPRRRHGDAAGRAAGRRAARRLRPRADPHPRPRPRRDEPGVPRGRVGERRQRQHRADRPAGGAGHCLLPHPRRGAVAGPRARRPLARPHTLRRGRGGRDHRPRPRALADLPGRHRGGGRRAATARRRRLVRRRRHGGTRARQARRRGARRARRAEPPRHGEGGSPSGRRHGDDRRRWALASSLPAARLAVITETDLTGSAGGSGHLDQGHAPDAVAAPQPGRPPPAAAG